MCWHGCTVQLHPHNRALVADKKRVCCIVSLLHMLKHVVSSALQSGSDKCTATAVLGAESDTHTTARSTQLAAASPAYTYAILEAPSIPKCVAQELLVVPFD